MDLPFPECRTQNFDIFAQVGYGCSLLQSIMYSMIKAVTGPYSKAQTARCKIVYILRLLCKDQRMTRIGGHNRWSNTYCGCFCCRCRKCSQYVWLKRWLPHPYLSHSGILWWDNGFDCSRRISANHCKSNAFPSWPRTGGDLEFWSPCHIFCIHIHFLLVHIQKFDSNWGFITKWGTYGTGNWLFVNPYGIATDSSGYVYVTDGENSRIQVFAPDGNLSIVSNNDKGNGDVPTSDTIGNTTSNVENPTPSQPAGITDQV